MASIMIDKQNQDDYRNDIIDKQVDKSRFSAEELSNLPISSSINGLTQPSKQDFTNRYGQIRISPKDSMYGFRMKMALVPIYLMN